MILIGENLHIISKPTRQALIDKNEEFILNLIKSQSHMDFIDLNVGPAKGPLEGSLPWLCNLVENNSTLNISFDTTNTLEMRNGISASKRPQNSILNSTSADEIKLEKVTDLACDFDCSLIALTLNKEIGIPKTADERLELAFQIFEKCMQKNIPSDKIFFDPLILPVCIDQSQSVQALDTIKIIKESFDPPVMTTIGLSNVSNGSPEHLRPFLNKIFLVLAYGAGLDSAIIDSFDKDLIDTIKMISSNNPKTPTDNLYINLSNMVKNFEELDSINFDKSNKEQANIIQAAKFFLNKETYSHSAFI